MYILHIVYHLRPILKPRSIAIYVPITFQSYFIRALSDCWGTFELTRAAAPQRNKHFGSARFLTSPFGHAQCITIFHNKTHCSKIARTPTNSKASTSAAADDFFSRRRLKCGFNCPGRLYIGSRAAGSSVTFELGARNKLVKRWRILKKALNDSHLSLETMKKQQHAVIYTACG